MLLARRPMAASSTERTVPDRWVAAWSMHITPHFQRAHRLPPGEASRPSAGRARCRFVGRHQLVHVPEAAHWLCPEPPRARTANPGLRAGRRGVPAPNRAPRPSVPTTRLPLRKSPCDHGVRATGGRLRSSQRNPSSNAGWGSFMASSSSRNRWNWSVGSRPETLSRSMLCTAARARPHCAASNGRADANSASRRIRRGWSPPRSAPPPSTTVRGTGVDAVAVEVAVDLAAGEDDGRHRHGGPAARSSSTSVSARLVTPPAGPAAGERPAVGLERPGLARRAREPAQRPHVAGAEGRCQSLGPGRARGRHDPPGVIRSGPGPGPRRRAGGGTR